MTWKKLSKYIYFVSYILFYIFFIGIVNNTLEVPTNGDTFYFQITDVGGQRSGRRKWFQIFSNSIDVIIFVMSLSGYSQIVYEDINTNCLDEAYTNKIK